VCCPLLATCPTTAGTIAVEENFMLIIQEVSQWCLALELLKNEQNAIIA
jgi:hypothetical protein